MINARPKVADDFFGEGKVLGGWARKEGEEEKEKNVETSEARGLDLERNELATLRRRDTDKGEASLSPYRANYTLCPYCLN